MARGKGCCGSQRGFFFFLSPCLEAYGIPGPGIRAASGNLHGICGNAGSLVHCAPS